MLFDDFVRLDRRDAMLERMQCSLAGVPAAGVAAERRPEPTRWRRG